jgi:hypothetical protein
LKISRRIDPLRQSGRRDPMRRGDHLELVVVDAIGRGESLRVSVTLHPMLCAEMDRDEYGRITVLTKDLMTLVSRVVIRTCNRVTGTSFKMEDATLRYQFPDGQTLGPFPESEF